MVGPSGLEPLTPVLSGLCSNQLSYGPEFMCNALIHYNKSGAINSRWLRKALRSLLGLSPRDARLSANKNLLVVNFYWRDAPNLNN